MSTQPPASATTTSGATRNDATSVRRVVLDEVRANQPGATTAIESFADSVPLGSGGLGISSLLLLRIFVKLEESFGFTFDDAAVANATFRTVGDLVHFVVQAVHDHPATPLESK